MALNALGMGFVFTAKDLATSVIGNVKKSIQEFCKTSEDAAERYKQAMAGFKSGGMMLGAGIAGLAAINKGTKYFGEYEYAMASVGQVMRATEEEMTALGKSAIQAGIDTQFSPVDAVMGLQALGAAGLNAQEGMKVLIPTLDLAAASLGQLSVEQASEAVIGSINAFGFTADKAGMIVDKLTRITQASNFQARDFGIGISNAASQAKAANQTYESMLAVMGMLRNTNLDASSSATAYREATRRLAGEEIAHKALKKLGIEVLDKEKNQIRNIVDIIGEMIPALEKVDAKKKNNMLTDILGVRGMKTYGAVIASYEKNLADGSAKVGDYGYQHRKLLGELDNSAGAAGKNRDALLATSKGMRILLEGSWQTFQVMLGETLSPVLYPALKLITDSLNKLIFWIRDIPKPIKAFFSYALGFASMFMLVAGAIKVTVAAIGLFKLAMAAAAAASAAATTGIAGGGGMFAAVGSAASAAIPVITIGAALLAGIFAKESAADEEWKKRQRSKMADLEKSIDLYKKTAEVMHDVKQEIAATLELEMKAAKRDPSKALGLIEKLQAEIGPLKVKVIEAHTKFLEVSNKAGAKDTEIAAAHAEWAKAASQLRAKEIARVDLEAMVAEKRYRSAKTVEDRRYYGEQIIAGRFVKQTAMEEKLAIWSRGQQSYLESLKREKSGDYNRKQGEYTREMNARKNEIKRWQAETGMTAARMGIDPEQMKLGKGKQREAIASTALKHISPLANAAENAARLSLVGLRTSAEGIKQGGGYGQGAREGSFTGFVKDVASNTWEVMGKAWDAGGGLWGHAAGKAEKAKAIPMPDLSAMIQAMTDEKSAAKSQLATGSRYEGMAGGTREGRAAMAGAYQHEEVTINLWLDGESVAKVVRKADGKISARKGGIGGAANGAPGPSGAKK